MTTTRRLFLGSAAATLFFTKAGAFANEVTKTPRQTEGPFYPDKLPLDTEQRSADRQRQHHASGRRDHAL